MLENFVEPDDGTHASLLYGEMSLRLFTVGFHDRAEWHVYKEVKVPMHEFQSFRQPLTAVMATFGVLPQECAVMMVVNHLPFLKSTTMSSPEAAVARIRINRVKGATCGSEFQAAKTAAPDRSL